MKRARLVSRLGFAGSLALAGSLLGSSLVAQQKEIAYESAGDFLKLPDDIHLGEVAGVATTATGNLWVYYQSGGPNATIGASRIYINGGARLLEFDRSGKYLREIGTIENERPYAFLFAQGVRVDPQNNIWIVDRASRMVVKFDQSGKVLLTLGRRLEAIGELGSSGVFGRASGPPGSGVPGDNFNQPLDVAWDAAGNIFIPDGYGNARVAKFDKNGKFLLDWGKPGTQPNEKRPGYMNNVHGIAVDPQTRRVYVNDRGNKRIQVFDENGKYLFEFSMGEDPSDIHLLYIGADRTLWAADRGTSKMLKYDLDGKFLYSWGIWGDFAGGFWGVHGFSVDQEGNFYTAEVDSGRVQKFRPKPGANPGNLVSKPVYSAWK